jgi:hypothetical protein
MAALVSTALPTPALADTLGLPPCTRPIEEWRMNRAPEGAPAVVAARDAVEWRRIWKAVGGNGPPPVVDFQRYSVLGVTSQKGGLVIYRVQIDNAEQPRFLEVRVAEGDAICNHDNRQMHPTGGAVHLVVTPRTALPIHFILDRMVDGGVFYIYKDGTDARPLGALEGWTPGPTVPVLLREEAERRARAAMTPEEVEQLSKGPLWNRKMDRFPHAWVELTVERLDDRWRVTYGKLPYDAADGSVRVQFDVEITTGTVTRARSQTRLFRSP